MSSHEIHVLSVLLPSPQGEGGASERLPAGLNHDTGHSGLYSVSVLCKPVSGHWELDAEEEKWRCCM